MRVAHLKLHHFPTQGVFNKASLITTSTVAIAQVTAAENRGLDVCHPVYHSSKTAKRHSKQQKSPLVYQSSPVYQDCTNTPTVYQSLCCSNQIVRLSRATNTVIYVVTKVWKAGTLAERNVRLSNLLISSCLVILC